MEMGSTARAKSCTARGPDLDYRRDASVFHERCRGNEVRTSASPHSDARESSSNTVPPCRKRAASDEAYMMLSCSAGALDAWATTMIKFGRSVVLRCPRPLLYTSLIGSI